MDGGRSRDAAVLQLRQYFYGFWGLPYGKTMGKPWENGKTIGKP
jgi:hypothetical protein